MFVDGVLFVQKIEMADRRDWGGGGEDPKESTQRMIERIWESLTDIRVRMEQQAPVPLAAVPPVVEVPVSPVAPPPRVEVPYVAPVPPPVMAVEEPVMQVEKCVPLCFTDVCMISLARLRPVRGRRTRIKFVSGLTGLNEAFRHTACYAHMVDVRFHVACAVCTWFVCMRGG
ncbi:hypothetical protein Taro_003288 [Colocasia esculenta]|uniref:Uncharacterized protein n=1 Tax=Colocasia esculenta TaxID=4460 RepID=A0A843TRE5_COLES|nr:hypothetical protein [Colocasia esculenta]